MTHAPTFNRATTHLLCPSAAGAKYAKARMWGTPVVDMSWLSFIAKTGALPPRDVSRVRFASPGHATARGHAARRRSADREVSLICLSCPLTRTKLSRVPHRRFLPPRVLWIYPPPHCLHTQALFYLHVLQGRHPLWRVSRTMTRHLHMCHLRTLRRR
ncbi:hypothetical protein BJV77DRAFT_391179 [Russula vinacea]|nr:hypothetical protein BJV77DRAFT_391179 [Russula vinacea]